jgi:hypothetical protein
MERRSLGFVAVILIAVIAGCADDAGDSVPGPTGDGPKIGLDAEALAAIAAKLTPDITLERLGTIGDYPAPGGLTVVNVNAEGVVTVGGKRLGLEGLKTYLGLMAENERDAEPPRASKWSVVLRLDRTLPWGVAQWLMQVCADPDLRISRVHFAVLPEQVLTPGEEGTLATHLPVDCEHTWAPDRLPDPLTVRVGPTGPGSDPSWLYTRLFAALDADPTLNCEVAGDWSVPTGFMLRVVDVFHRAGARDITFVGAPPPFEFLDFSKIVYEARWSKVSPTITLFDVPIGGDAATPGEVPAVERIRGGIAGTVGLRCASLCRSSYPAIPTIPPHVKIQNLSVEGGDGTQVAVELGLAWLARHQEPEGYWDCDGFEGRCEDGKCGGPGSLLYDPGVTGLALLAFLGRGETPEIGRYRKTVTRGLRYLRAIQDPEGCFGARYSNRFTYNHAAASLAMIQAYAITGRPTYKRPAQKAIDFIIKCQNPYLAWRYGVRPQDNDTSVTGGMVMALWAARKTGKLSVPAEGLEGARLWLNKITEPEYGKAGYTARGTGPARPQDIMDKFTPDKSEALTAVGMFSRILMGDDPRSSDLIHKGVDLCMRVPPKWDERDGSIDMYYWYYGSMAMFQIGGEPWQKWNAAMKKTALENQVRAGCQAGSWHPIGPWGREGGRVYATALMTMCLEVYYRYDRIFPTR